MPITASDAIPPVLLGTTSSAAGAATLRLPRSSYKPLTCDQRAINALTCCDIAQRTTNPEDKAQQQARSTTSSSSCLDRPTDRWTRTLPDMICTEASTLVLLSFNTQFQPIQKSGACYSLQGVLILYHQLPQTIGMHRE